MPTGLSTALSIAGNTVSSLGTKAGVEAQNISNIGITGAKKKEFLFASQGAASKQDLSLTGVRGTPFMVNDFQGAIIAGRESNFAINGKGWLISSSQNSNTSPGTFYYTRSGLFEPNQKGDFQHATNQSYLRYYPTDNTGTPLATNVSTVTTTSVLNINNIKNLNPSATTSAKLSFNLPSNAAIGATSAQVVSIPYFDSLGVPGTLTLTFTKTAETPGVNQTWQGIVTLPTGAPTGTIAAPWLAGCNIVFDNTGRITTVNGAAPTAAVPAPAIGVTWTAGTTAANLNIVPDFGLAGATQVTAQGVSFVQRGNDIDGYGPGTLNKITTDKGTGVMSAIYDNGAPPVKFGILPLAMFNNDNGLSEGNGNLYTVSADSGPPIIQFSGKGGAGEVLQGQIEDSTIEAVQSLINMMGISKNNSYNLKVVHFTDKMTDALDHTI